jgi:hypothetical protein
MTRSIKILDGKTITHRYVRADDLPDEVPVADIASGALLDYLPVPGKDLGSDYPTPGSVTIAVTSAGRPTIQAAKSWLNLQYVHRADDLIKWVIVPNGPYMDQGRNRTAWQSLALYDTEWVMTLDDDIEFSPQDLTDIIDWATRHGRHVVGGIYASPHDGINYAVAYRHDDDNLAPDGQPDGYIDLTVAEIDAMDPDDPTTCTVAAVGTGFLLVHRAVLELMRFVYAPPQPWYAELTVPMPDPRDEMEELLGTHLGEDLTFCRRLWAIGVPVHVHPAIRFVHYKTLGIQIPDHPSRRVE